MRKTYSPPEGFTETFKEFIPDISLCLSTDDLRPALNHILIEPKALVATDGHMTVVAYHSKMALDPSLGTSDMMGRQISKEQFQAIRRSKAHRIEPDPEHKRRVLVKADTGKGVLVVAGTCEDEPYPDYQRVFAGFQPPMAKRTAMIHVNPQKLADLAKAMWSCTGDQFILEAPTRLNVGIRAIAYHADRGVFAVGMLMPTLPPGYGGWNFGELGLADEWSHDPVGYRILASEAVVDAHCDLLPDAFKHEEVEAITTDRRLPRVVIHSRGGVVQQLVSTERVAFEAVVVDYPDEGAQPEITDFFAPVVVTAENEVMTDIARIVRDRMAVEEGA